MKYLIYSALALLLGIAPSLAQTSSSNILPPASVQKELSLQGGPGIVVSGSARLSELPADARKLLSSDYPDNQPTSITRNFVRNTYHVTLSDGTRITFDKSGKVANIIAPAGLALPMEVLADILPEKTSVHLAEAGIIGDVSEVKNADGHGILVMTLHTTPPRMLFDLDGNFLLFYD